MPRIANVIAFVIISIVAVVAFSFDMPSYFTTEQHAQKIISEKKFVLEASPDIRESKILNTSITFEEILPAFDYGERFGGLGKQYPIDYVSSNCLTYFSIIGNSMENDKGMYIANWLNENGQNIDDYIIFSNAYSFYYDTQPGWKSGSAQGIAAECFMSAYDYSDDSKYLDLAKRALYALRVPINKGGILINEGDNKWWYEEYADLESQRSFVLNGHMVALFSLHKYLQYHEDVGIQELFDNGLKALKEDALLYDNGINDSFHDRLGLPANKFHERNIGNFEKLYDITKDEELLEIKAKFMN